MTAMVVVVVVVVVTITHLRHAAPSPHIVDVHLIDQQDPAHSSVVGISQQKR